MRKFLYTGRQTTIQVIFKYDLSGNLIAFECEGPATTLQLNWLYENLPKNIAQIEALKNKYKINIVEIKPDLNFEKFYNTYNYKIGNKKRANKLWEELSDSEKTMAIVKLQQYEQWLRLRPNQDKAYPETYLSQRRWENEYKF